MGCGFEEGADGGGMGRGVGEQLEFGEDAGGAGGIFDEGGAEGGDDGEMAGVLGGVGDGGEEGFFAREFGVVGGGVEGHAGNGAGEDGSEEENGALVEEGGAEGFVEGVGEIGIRFAEVVEDGAVEVAASGVDFEFGSGGVDGGGVGEDGGAEGDGGIAPRRVGLANEEEACVEEAFFALELGGAVGEGEGFGGWEVDGLEETLGELLVAVEEGLEFGGGGQDVPNSGAGVILAVAGAEVADDTHGGEGTNSI